MIQSASAMDQPVDGKRPLTRSVLLIGLPVAVVLLLAVIFVPRMQSWMSAERTVDAARLRFGTVTRGDLERDLSVQGRIVAAFHPTTFSPTSGIVVLEVRAGDVVEQGQVLARVESPELENRLEQERSSVRSMDSELERQKILAKQRKLADRQAVDLAGLELDAAKRAMRRAGESRQEGIINDVDYETAEDELQRARLALAHAEEDAVLTEETLDFETRNRELQVERQQLAVDELERQVAELIVRAPVAGLVSRLDVEDRDAVGPAQPLVTVVDLSAFEVEVMIPESYADEVGPGTPVTVRQGNDRWEASVKTISPEVEGGQVRGIVAFAGSIPDGLRQNQRVSTRLVLDSRTDVLKVQRGPFIEATGGRRAYLVDGDNAVSTAIRTGASSVSEVEVLEGLREGDRIIISDTARFQDAATLYLRK